MATRTRTGARPRARFATVGTSPPRREAADKVTGRARYIDDIVVPGVLHGRTVRSTVARGIVRGVRLDPAFDWRDVVVADHRDIPGENVVALIADDQPLLAARDIRHADEPVLLVAHADPERAEAARRAVTLDIEPLPPVLTVEDALARTAVIHGDDNVYKEIVIARGDVDAGFAAADHVLEARYHCGHQEQLYIETNGMLAEVADGVLTVRGSLQCPYYVQRALERMFALPPERVRVVQTVTGGGFGGKEEYPSMIGGHAALLAWKSGRPAKIVYDRLEDIAATTKRHPAVTRVRAGVTRDGTLLAWESDVVMDGGAYETLTPVVLSRGAIHAAGPYRCPNVRIRARGVATNTPPNGAFRGFGAPQTQFAAECHMDRLAEALGLDPLALRRRNAYDEGDVTPTGQVLRESVGAKLALEETARRVQWPRVRRALSRANAAAARAERAGRFAAGGRRLRRGIGLALVWHGAGFTGSGEVKLASLAALDLAPDGWPRILTANTEIGQGTITSFAQLVGETLGIRPERVHVNDADTAQVPDSGPTVASRTVMVVGGLLERCAAAMREQLEAFAGCTIEGEHAFRRVARRWLATRGPLAIARRYQPPPGIAWDDDHYRGDAYGVFSYAGIAVEVEVDLDTGETRVVRVLTAQEIGRAIHPVLAAGQIEGGTLQGLGWALLEDVRWKDGRVWNHQLTNYIIPTAVDAPPIQTVLLGIPYARGPFGAKGVGELPMDAPAPAVVEAIAHATGVRVSEIPVTPERLLAALARREADAPARAGARA
ncbi:MAG TPA: xanthine dehydrogenase family protein molybdopterin-binding subunit [Candidatus Eisenbacteria bacterium]|nr:xanthine dehydrogenase family protein molybdopterin-binding subunit [Candidatus Eisenbacteria bacterium]